MLKMRKHYAQFTETLCSKCRNVMLKTRKCSSQNAETLCSKCGNIMLNLRKRYTQNAETLCSICGNVMLKMQKHYFATYPLTVSQRSSMVASFPGLPYFQCSITFSNLIPRPHPINEEWLSGEPSQISWASTHSYDCNLALIKPL